MLIPIQLIKKYLDKSLTTNDIVDSINKIGVEVESISSDYSNLLHVIIAEVLSVEKHPNADSLQIASVYDGIDTYQVVCGAKNCRAGIKVAFAKIGAQLSSDEGGTFTIKKAKIRGIESFGMLCSHEELQVKLSPFAIEDGIMELASDVILGTHISSVLPSISLELGITPNLGHCCSAIGLAREIAAITQTQFYHPVQPITANNNEAISININTEDCFVYASSIIDSIKIEESPYYIQNILISAGIKAINNIVDILNYVMLETGQPMHAFDAMVSGNQISICNSPNESTLTVIGGKEIQVKKGSLIVQNDLNILALAGVIGSQDSSITNQTTKIFIESAMFSPKAVRLASKQSKINTDASYRFSRGTDYEMATQALIIAQTMITNICVGSCITNFYHIENAPLNKPKITLRISYVNKLLSTSFTSQDVSKMLSSLNFYIDDIQNERVTIIPPSYRLDINEEVDLIEEILKIHGLDHVGSQQHNYMNQNVYTDSFNYKKQIRLLCLKSGLSENYSCDLLSDDEFNKIPSIINKDATVNLANTGSSGKTLLRPSLIFGLLKTASFHVNRQMNIGACFELGEVYKKENTLYTEELSLGILLYGNQYNDHWSIQPKPPSTNFFCLKGILENILEELGCLINISFEASSEILLHPGQQASILLNNTHIGMIGSIHPKILKQYNLDAIPVIFSEIKLSHIIKYCKKSCNIQEPPIYPCIERDETINVIKTTPVGKICELIIRKKGKWLEKVRLVSVYESEKIGIDKKNICLRFSYRDITSTLSSKDIDNEHNNIIAAMKSELITNNWIKE